MNIAQKLNKKRQEAIDKMRKEQSKEVSEDKDWARKKKRLTELGLMIYTTLDDSDTDNKKSSAEFAGMMRQATEYIRQDKEIPLDFKLKLLRYTRPELFNSDGTPKVDISKLGNIE